MTVREARDYVRAAKGETAPRERKAPTTGKAASRLLTQVEDALDALSKADLKPADARDVIRQLHGLAARFVAVASDLAAKREADQGNARLQAGRQAGRQGHAQVKQPRAR